MFVFFGFLVRERCEKEKKNLSLGLFAGYDSDTMQILKLSHCPGLSFAAHIKKKKKNTEKVAKKTPINSRVCSITKPSAGNKLYSWCSVGSFPDIIQHSPVLHFSCRIYPLFFMGGTSPLSYTFQLHGIMHQGQHPMPALLWVPPCPLDPFIFFLSIQMETNYSGKKQMSCSRKRTAFIVLVFGWFFSYFD